MNVSATLRPVDATFCFRDDGSVTWLSEQPLTRAGAEAIIAALRARFPLRCSCCQQPLLVDGERRDETA